MILLNGQEIKIERFPDGTQRLNVRSSKSFVSNNITWRYESEIECMTLWFVVKHLRNNNPLRIITLTLPYVPNARMDRINHNEEVFTLKWFAEFINSLNFNKVIVLDPHSNVTTALIDKIKVENPIDHIKEILDMFKDFNPVLYFPDAGAMKRYEGMLNEYPYLYGEKKRCWETGEILGLDLKGDVKRIEEIENPIFLMVDDICSYGGTFYYSAKALKEAFPTSKIYSWTTHTENKFPTLQKAFDEGLIESHFTTDSLYRSQNDKIKVLPC
jgi:ribose-phosphate pyrophosphokinase